MSSTAVGRLDIARYIEQVLSAWSSKVPFFREVYRALPFGSRILIEDIGADTDKVKVRFLSNAGFAKTLSSLAYLRTRWDLPSRSWPALVSVEKLRHVRYLNGNVSVVEMPERHGQQPFVLKSNLRDPAAIYHELRLLLEMDPHPNIIGKPRYIVTAEGEEGSDSQVKVLGFVVEYTGSGTLSAALERDPDLPLRTRMRWATQITQTMAILSSRAGFYSDLKPDNLLVAPNGLDLILIEFEQGGNWDTFLTPEISYTMWMETLARSRHVPQARRERYTALLNPNAGGHDTATEAPAAPSNQTQLFRSRWEYLLPQQREQAMVFAVGKLLWCIFEGCSHMRNSTDERYEAEAPIEFSPFPWLTGMT
jgi:serine/threonine protein kinase